MGTKYYHVTEPCDYYIDMDSDIRLERVKTLLRCEKIEEVSEDEYLKNVSPYFYELEQRGKELNKATDRLIGEVIEKFKKLTPEETERFRAQIAQCGFSAEEIESTCRNLAMLV